MKLPTPEQALAYKSMRWLTFSEALQYARMSKNTLKKHIARGNISASMIGGKYIVDRESVDRFFEKDDLMVKEMVENILTGQKNK